MFKEHLSKINAIEIKISALKSLETTLEIGIERLVKKYTE